MKRALTLALCLILACTACAKKNTPSPVPTPAPTSRPSSTESLGPYAWWSLHAAFSNFPQYRHEGSIAPGYEEGAVDVTSTNGCYQFVLYGVRYADYLAYISDIVNSGISLYNPYGEFVPQSEIEQESVEGSSTFTHNGYKLNVVYSLRQMLVFQLSVLSPSANT